MKTSRLFKSITVAVLALGLTLAPEGNIPLLWGFDILAGAADTSGDCGDDVHWTLDGGTLTIYGSGAMSEWSCEPAPWDSSKYSINRIVIEDGVTTVGAEAFLNCTDLTSAVIPDSVAEIGDKAFIIPDLHR